MTTTTIDPGEALWREANVDLWTLLLPLLRRWWVIVLVVLVSELAVVASYMKFVPLTYEAEALVYLRPIDYSIGPNEYVNPDYNRTRLSLSTIERFAASDRVLSATFDALKTQHPESFDMTFDAFRHVLHVNPVADSGDLLGLAVQLNNPAVSALAANIWSQTLVNNANILFGGSDVSLIQAQQLRADELANELAMLQSQLRVLDPGSPEAIQVHADVNAKTAIYESLVVSIAYVESGLYQRYALQIASEAGTPVEPVRRSLPLILTVTGISALTISMLSILLMSSWSQRRQRAAHGTQPWATGHYSAHR